MTRLMSRRERKHLRFLERRAAWVRNRSGGDYDLAEVAALDWVIALAREHFGRWQVDAEKGETEEVARFAGAWK